MTKYLIIALCLVVMVAVAATGGWLIGEYIKSPISFILSFTFGLIVGVLCAGHYIVYQFNN